MTPKTQREVEEVKEFLVEIGRVLQNQCNLIATIGICHGELIDSDTFKIMTDAIKVISDQAELLAAIQLDPDAMPDRDEQREAKGEQEIL